MESRVCRFFWLWICTPESSPDFEEATFPIDDSLSLQAGTWKLQPSESTLFFHMRVHPDKKGPGIIKVCHIQEACEDSLNIVFKMHMEVKKEQTKEVDSAQPSFLSHGGGWNWWGKDAFLFLFKASLQLLIL